LSETDVRELTGSDGRKVKAQERTERQRDRILEAARQCFIEHGFHAASMANIAEAAQMSPGLIYRYFENKNAIILAIIERQLEDSRSGIDALSHGADLGEVFGDVFARLQRGDEGMVDPTLFLEMSAQGPRDPQIAQALSHSDQITRAGLGAWLERAAANSGSKLSPGQIAGRALVLQCLFEGLVVRAAREPGLDPALMAQSLELFIPHLQVSAAETGT
jgi:AcrR family transcriptional regulator